MIIEKFDDTCIGVDHQALDTTTSHFSFAEQYQLSRTNIVQSSFVIY